MRFTKIIGKIGLGMLFLGLYTLIVMYLWNWLIPDYFGLEKINFVQTLGFLVLFKLLFLGHGWHHYRHRQNGSHRHKEKWKARFKDKLEQYCQQEQIKKEDTNKSQE
ncbi:hypothetical protein QQ008_19940 [Fulvivirgaceae bacterium BMA10]|uniref:Uncharacterized protein n=1 Tax=Splendidivirga corallicola TaxID=3051826 RepID=A0ABT8KSE2_9BACT|nr:hypothetical protein [Fulvivirgaceae bacterium BMA10]